jgi:hypothetical protein
MSARLVNAVDVLDMDVKTWLDNDDDDVDDLSFDECEELTLCSVSCSCCCSLFEDVDCVIALYGKEVLLIAKT